MDRICEIQIYKFSTHVEPHSYTFSNVHDIGPFAVLFGGPILLQERAVDIGLSDSGFYGDCLTVEG